MVFLTKVVQRGSGVATSIPRHLRESLGIMVGDTMGLRVLGEYIIMWKLTHEQLMPKQPFPRILPKLPGDPFKTDEETPTK